MRLLSTTTLQLDSFIEPELPKYAILSHTWGKEEYLFEDVQSGLGQNKEGYRKVHDTCTVAQNRGYEWVWIDTCCIDKSSSAELSEAINSMFRWYQDAHFCMVFLSDVQVSDIEPAELANSDARNRLSHSAYFQRGWTLQELIAPERYVEFFSSEWHSLGTRASLATRLHERTKIDLGILNRPERLGEHGNDTAIKSLLQRKSVAARMSWASYRLTTRPEDIAYCLIGLFQINMPLLYGEGQTSAFVRLQEHILRRYDDHSILSWHGWNTGGSGWAASHPISFHSVADIVPIAYPCDYTVSERGLRLRLKVWESSGRLLASLNCHRAHNLTSIAVVDLNAWTNDWTNDNSREQVTENDTTLMSWRNRTRLRRQNPDMFPISDAAYKSAKRRDLFIPAVKTERELELRKARIDYIILQCQGDALRRVCDITVKTSAQHDFVCSQGRGQMSVMRSGLVTAIFWLSLIDASGALRLLGLRFASLGWTSEWYLELFDSPADEARDQGWLKLGPSDYLLGWHTRRSSKSELELAPHSRNELSKALTNAKAPDSADWLHADSSDGTSSGGSFPVEILTVEAQATKILSYQVIEIILSIDPATQPRVKK